MATANLTPELLRETLSYAHETGAFTWTKGSHSRRIGCQAGSAHPSGYRFIRVQNVRYAEHRLAWFFMHGVWPTGEIDHINGVRSDNRICNLRDVSKSTNMQNLRTAPAHNKASGLLGSRKSQTAGKWLSEIVVNGVKKHIGTFDTPEGAHLAYLAEKRKSHVGCVI